MDGGARKGRVAPSATAAGAGAAGAAAEGPFSKLNICAVHLGSVTSNTVAAWTREVRRGGGKVATIYTPGETTHIVADPSLSSDQLDRYRGWELPWHV
ncbi:unnamed protein product, partial [Laminaria digitata]